MDDLCELREVYEKDGIVKIGNYSDIFPNLRNIDTLTNDVTVSIAENSRASVNIDHSYETIRVRKHGAKKGDEEIEHFEITRQQLTRVENFVSSHPEWTAMCDEISYKVGLICSEPDDSGQHTPWPLYKEKLNMKPAGGCGFAPHFDSPSLQVVGLAQEFVTVMIAIDDMTSCNGCLAVSKGQRSESDVHQMCGMNSVVVEAPTYHDTLQSKDKNGEHIPLAASLIDPDGNGRRVDPDGNGRRGALLSHVSDSLVWEEIECISGDIYLFSARLPHRSGVNKTQLGRRAVFLTFNSPEEGEDLRELYYMLMKNLRAEYQKYQQQQQS